MITSERTERIYTALAAAQAQIKGALKDSTNPHFKSQYADLDSIWEAAREPLTKNGLSVVQDPITEFIGLPTRIEWTTRNGDIRSSVQIFCKVTMVSRLCHTSGEFVEGSPLSAFLGSGDPQAIGMAVTYLRRYTFAPLVGIAPADDDAESTVNGGSEAKDRARPVLNPANTTDAVADAVRAVKPQHYDEWLINMAATADNGLAAMSKAWKESSTDLREYVNLTAAKTVAGWRAKAQAVDQRGAAQAVSA